MKKLWSPRGGGGLNVLQYFLCKFQSASWTINLRCNVLLERIYISPTKLRNSTKVGTIAFNQKKAGRKYESLKIVKYWCTYCEMVQLAKASFKHSNFIPFLSILASKLSPKTKITPTLFQGFPTGLHRKDVVVASNI